MMKLEPLLLHPLVHLIECALGGFGNFACCSLRKSSRSERKGELKLFQNFEFEITKILSLYRPYWAVTS